MNPAPSQIMFNNKAGLEDKPIITLSVSHIVILMKEGAG
jgi:hypothetical protein